MRHWTTIWIALMAMGCGSSSGDNPRDGGSGPNHVENPQPHEGGGLGSGEISGELNVFVIDGQSGDLISGAQVQLGDGHVEEPLTGTTGDNGLVVFREKAVDGDGLVGAKPGALSGPQVVTASIEGYPPTTWFGVNGAVVTIPLEPIEEDPGPVPTAVVRGTIAGWDDIPDPPTGVALVAVVQYTAVPGFDAPENQIEQDPGPIPGVALLTANTCFRLLDPPPPLPPIPLDSCDFTLNTRTGTQAVYAVLIEINLQTQLPDVVGFAVLTGLDLAADEELQDVQLELIDPADILEVEVMLEDLPSGVNQLGWLAAIDLGAEGLLGSPSLGGGDTVLLPEATGSLAGRYVVTAQASDQTEALPRSAIFEYDADVTAPVALGDWLSIPDDIEVDQSVEPNTYSFDRVDEASAHIVALDDTDGTPVWRVLLLDPPTSGSGEGRDGGVPQGPGPVITFALPTLSPDPLPLGNLDMTTSAIDVVGFDPLDFSIEGIDQEDTRRVSMDRARFRRE